MFPYYVPVVLHQFLDLAIYSRLLLVTSDQGFLSYMPGQPVAAPLGTVKVVFKREPCQLRGKGNGIHPARRGFRVPLTR